MNAHDEIQPDDQQLHSNWWRLQGVFFEPGATFDEIRQRPNWVIPFLAILILTLAGFTFVLETVGRDEFMRQQIMQNPRIQQMTPEERDRILSSTLESPIVAAMQYVGPMINMVRLLIIAGVLFGAVILAGGESRFIRVFSVSCHAFFAYSVIATVLLLLVVALAPDKSAIDFQNPVQSNLGYFVGKESPALRWIASSMDLISFYAIWLFALGLSKTSGKLSFGTSLVVVVIPWLFYVGLFALVSALFS